MLYSDAAGYQYEGNGFLLRLPFVMHTDTVKELAVFQGPLEGFME